MNELETLQIENEELKRVVAGLDKSARMLVRRDLELRRANEQLRQLDHSKSEFVSIAAHQLRTPLSAIRWAQQMLIDGDIGPLTDEQIAMLEQSQHSIARMVHMVNDLLNADHLEFGQATYDFKKINLAKVFTEIAHELESMAKERDIGFTLDIPHSVVEVTCDSAKMKEVFSNMINNAIKYTPAHGSVRLGLKPEGESVVITFADTGIGIPQKDHKNLFGKFSRSDNAKKIDADGSGLGLFIVKKIVEGHRGSISFETEEGVGTTFTLLLPKSN